MNSWIPSPLPPGDESDPSSTEFTKGWSHTSAPYTHLRGVTKQNHTVLNSMPCTSHQVNIDHPFNLWTIKTFSLMHSSHTCDVTSPETVTCVFVYRYRTDTAVITCDYKACPPNWPLISEQEEVIEGDWRDMYSAQPLNIRCSVSNYTCLGATWHGKGIILFSAAAICSLSLNGCWELGSSYLRNTSTAVWFWVPTLIRYQSYKWEQLHFDTTDLICLYD